MTIMKKRYIIGIALGLVFIVVAIFSYNSNSIEYSNFTPAKSSGKKVQVIGSWVKEKSSDYNSEKNIFTFYMNDKEHKEAKVIFSGSKPNNFALAQYFVVTGKFQGNDFIASDILTKCPSKYEGTMKDIKE